MKKNKTTMNLAKVYKTDTDLAICVYEGASLSIVTMYDPISRTHERKGTYSTFTEAITAAKYLVKRYIF